MPLKLRNKTYTLPGEAGQKRITGAELDVIEMHFDVDGLALMRAIDPAAPRSKGVSRNRAVNALVWIALHRLDPEVTLDSVMDEYAIDEFDLFDDEPDTTGPKGSEGEENPEPVT